LISHFFCVCATNENQCEQIVNGDFFVLDQQVEEILSFMQID